MQSLSSSPSTRAAAAAADDKLRHLSAEARAGYERYVQTGELEALDPVIFAILDDYVPRTPAKPLADLPGTTTLMEDLGFDSLAITEVVFSTEDLFGINITNEEIIQVRTLDDLRTFVRRKIAPQQAG